MTMNSSSQKMVHRPERLTEQLPAVFAKIPVVAHVCEVQAVDAILVCMPAELVAGVVHDPMQRKVSIVECAVFHDEAWRHLGVVLERYGSTGGTGLAAQHLMAVRAAGAAVSFA